MRRAGITQKDIDKARKSQEVSLIEHCKQLRYVMYSPVQHFRHMKTL